MYWRNRIKVVLTLNLSKYGETSTLDIFPSNIFILQSYPKYKKIIYDFRVPDKPFKVSGFTV